MQTKAATIAKQRLDLAHERLCEALDKWEQARSPDLFDHAFVTAEVRLEQARRHYTDAKALLDLILAHDGNAP